MMITMVGGWMFLLVLAHPGSPRQRAKKQLLLLSCCNGKKSTTCLIHLTVTVHGYILDHSHEINRQHKLELHDALTWHKAPCHYECLHHCQRHCLSDFHLRNHSHPVTSRSLHPTKYFHAGCLSAASESHLHCINSIHVSRNFSINFHISHQLYKISQKLRQIW